MSDTNINNYSIKELLEFANIYDKKIETITKKDIIYGIDRRIIRAQQLNKPKYVHFFESDPDFESS